MRSYSILFKELNKKKVGKFINLLKDKSAVQTYSTEEQSVNVSAFKNLSSGRFTDCQLSVLNKGPNFFPGLKSLSNIRNLFDIYKSEILERVDLNNARLTEFAGGMISILNESFLNVKNSSSCEPLKNTLNVLKSNKEICILKSDKTSRMIAVDKSDYDSMLNTATIDTGNFSEVRTVMAKTRQANFNKDLFKIASNYSETNTFVNAQLKNLKATHPTPASAYVLPKDHKTGQLKGRPIIAAVDGPGVRLAKFMSKKLDNILHYVPAHLKNCDQFLSKIASIDTSNIGGFASLDVVNLYGSIPKNESSNIINIWDALKEFFNSYGKNEPFLNLLNTDDFINLVALSLNNDYVLFSGKQFKQTNGLSMGNPIAPQLAIIYMHYIETQIQSKVKGIIHWYRYIDDIFIVWDNSETTDNIIRNANSINSAIQFTIEKPNDEGKLAFLDAEIFIEESRFTYRLFCKPIYSGATVSWSSDCPFSLKVNILINEFIRARRRSSSDNLANYSYSLVKKRFLLNGYPKHIISMCFRRFKNKNNGRITRSSNTTVKFLRFPFTDESLKRKANSLIRRTNLQDQVRLWFDNGPALRSLLKPPKEKPQCKLNCQICILHSKGYSNQCQIKNTVYHIECSFCKKIYIGETYRQTYERMMEHKNPNNKKDSVVQHFDSYHPTSDISFNWKLIQTNITNTRKRRFLESIYIHRVPPEKLMNGCRGVDLPFDLFQ